MADIIITSQLLDDYHKQLIMEEKSVATIDKYTRETIAFHEFASGRAVTKELTVAYKEALQKRNNANVYNDFGQ